MSRLGWKLAFGAPEALSRLGLERPLVAPLPDDGLLDSGATVSLAGWTKPGLEVEIAIWIGRGLGAAVEIVDVAFPPDDVERILASGIYHRNVLLGPPRTQTLAGAAARVTCDGVEVGATDDLTSRTGEHGMILETVRGVCGRDLREGEVVIAGAVMPAFPLAPGQHWHVDLGSLGALSVATSGGAESSRRRASPEADRRPRPHRRR